MSNEPAFMLYSADFLIGVMDMTMEERGQYITLMCLQHQKGHLSDETIRFCLGSVSDKVMGKFSVDENGLFYSDRLDEEIEKRVKFTKSRQENGKKGGRPKQSETDRFSVGYPVGLPTENLHENENENENKNDNINTLNPCPYEKIKDLYNSTCISFPKIRVIDGKRKETVRARWRTYGSLDVFKEVFERAEASRFLRGANESAWTADFDWMLRPTNMAKILEGKYEKQPAARSSGNIFLDMLREEGEI